MHQATVISDDAALLDDLLRISAAAGVAVHIDAQGARMHWQRAALVVVDAAQAARIGRAGLPRRPGVIVVTRDQVLPERVWPDALALGAEHVVSLPDGERWLLTRLRQVHDGPSRDGQITAVIGACGGAGASTLAVGLARAARTGGADVLLIDADPLSAGIDLILGADEATGSRWGDVQALKGAVSTASLRDALPTVQGVTVLAPTRDRSQAITSDTLSDVLDAGSRGFDHLIIDLPCTVDPMIEMALGRAAQTLLITPADVLATCRARVVAEYVQRHANRMRFIVRRVREGLEPSVVSDALQIPLDGTIDDRVRVREAINTGDPPDVDDVFASICRTLVNPHTEGKAA